MAVHFCTTSAELVTALLACVAADIIRLDRTVTFTGAFILWYKGVIASGSEIIIESDTDAADLPLVDSQAFPHELNHRVFPQHAANLAKLQTIQADPNTNDRVLKTEEGQAVNGYIIRRLEILPSYKGGSSQIQLGRNDATQTTYSQVPYNITFDQVILRGHPISGQRSGIANHSRDMVVKNSYIYDHKTVGGEAVGIGGGNFNGSMKILNTTIECAGIAYILGGADNRIQTVATVAASPAPTLTTATLSSVADLSVGQRLSGACGANTYRQWPLVTAIDGLNVTFEAINTVFDVPGNVVWGANPVDIEVYRCHLKRPLAWRDPILSPVPVITQAVAVPAAVGLAAGSYFEVVQALHDDLGFQGNTYWSDVSAEIEITVTETSEIQSAWTVPTDPIPTTKTRLYRYEKDGSGNRINARYYLVTGVTTFTDTNTAGTVYTSYPGTSRWTTKNLGECKIGSGWHIHECISEHDWDMGGGSHGFWGKNSNQEDGPGHAFCEVDDLLIEWCLWRGTLGGLSLSTQRSSSNQPISWGKKCANWTVRHVLFYDSDSSWANAGRPAWVYGTVLAGAGDDFEFDHITSLHQNTSNGAMTIGSFGLGGYAIPTEDSYFARLKITNSLWLRGNFGFKADAVGEGKLTLDAVTENTIDFDRNVVAGAAAGSYNFAAKTNYFPDVPTFENQLKNFASTGIDAIGDKRLKRLSEGDDIDSLYLNAGTDGKDLGCDVAELMVRLDGVIEGFPSGGSPPPPAGPLSEPRLRRPGNPVYAR